jgi:hypothetical protein
MSLEQTTARNQHGVKRSVDDDSDEEDVQGPMARRQKAAAKDPYYCSKCSKVFKRPCDLTYVKPTLLPKVIANDVCSKHEKTHSREWKCSVPTCEYYEYGYARKAGLDRHVSEKHSAKRSMYKCHYCSYESVRETNCKQHMEREHGWEYVRSRKSGKNNKKNENGVTPPKTSMSTQNSIDFNAPTPDFSEGHASYQSPAPRPAGLNPFNELSSPTEPTSTPFTEMFGAFNYNEWADMNGFRSENGTESTESSHHPSWDTTTIDPSAPVSAFESPIDYYESVLGEVDWRNTNNASTSFNHQPHPSPTFPYQPPMDYDEYLFGDDSTSSNLQHHTTATSVNPNPFYGYTRNPSVPRDERRGGHATLLPSDAQADTMLYNPYSLPFNDIAANESYVESFNRPNHDIPLSGNSNTSSLNPTADGAISQEELFQIAGDIFTHHDLA